MIWPRKSSSNRLGTTSDIYTYFIRVYTTTGVFDESTTNKRDFKGDKLLFRDKPKARDPALTIPGYKG